MQKQSSQAPQSQHQRGLIFGIAIGVVAGLVGGAVASGLLYQTPAPEASSPLAASDCTATSGVATNTSAPFSIRVQAEGTSLPVGLEQSLSAGTEFAYAQWQGWLGTNALRQSQINIRFLGDARRFQEIYGKPDAQEWTTTGFYRKRSNEALILYTPAYRSSALGNTFHEVSHLITAQHLGVTPPWLNEGLAEHYETLRIDANASRFAANVQHLQLLRKRTPLSINALTQLSRQEWMREDAERRYASAWALIAFLMDSPRGEQTLKHTIQSAYAARCEPGGNLRDMLARYPGGMDSLQDDWQNWLSGRYAALRPAGSVVAETAL
ncbi:peptidase MA family metallohydrolase [Congregibacter sp.]|uniref:peptidase MA family metallohydrolase n=1 Tax=Congregibacter sp. TaxID=2744308 RepID=UPI003F6BC58D